MPKGIIKYIPKIIGKIKIPQDSLLELASNLRIFKSSPHTLPCPTVA